METRVAIHKRKSVRHFDPDRPIDDDTIRSLLESGIRAPSAGNQQSWKIYVIKNTERKGKLVEAAFGAFFMAAAPVILVICIDLARVKAAYGSRGLELYGIQDTAALTATILIAAADRGLGSCWVGAFDERYCAKVLSLGESMRPVVLIPLGFAADETAMMSRRPLDEVAVWVD